MEIQEMREKIATEIIELLAKRECTYQDSREISSIVERALREQKIQHLGAK